MSGEPEDAPVDAASILEGVVAIETELDLESVVRGGDDPGSPSSPTAGRRSLCGESEPIPVGDRESSVAGPEETRTIQGDQSTASKDGVQAEREASHPTLAGGETTSSNENFELGENVVVLRCNSNARGAECTVYLVGTAHVSQESCDEVRAVIRNVKPRIVFLELCSSRVALLMPQNLKVPTFEEMVNMYKKKDMNAFGVLYSWFIARVASTLEVPPGSEFRVAYEEAYASGARVVLGDRPVQVTLRRTWGRLSCWQKTKLIFALIFQGFFMPSAEELNKFIEDLKNTDMVTAIIQEMSKSFPSLIDTVVHERDLYMTATLRGVSQNSSSVVAVVGKGHLQGISQNWEKDISIEELLTVPTKKPSWFSKPVVRWSTVAVAAGGLAVFIGVYCNRKS